MLHRNYESTASPVRLTWYDDRVELFSPGGPYGAVTVENFGRPGVTDYRNPVLAEAMRNLGYRDAGQCAAVHGGGEGPRGEARQGPSRALDGTILLLDVLPHDAQRRTADGPGEVGADHSRWARQ